MSRPIDISQLARVTPRTIHIATGTGVAIPAGTVAQVSSFSGEFSMLLAPQIGNDTWLHINSIAISLNTSQAGAIMISASCGINVLPAANLLHGLADISGVASGIGGLPTGMTPILQRAIDAWIKLEEFLQQGPVTAVFPLSLAAVYNNAGTSTTVSLISTVSFDAWREQLGSGPPKD